MEDSLDDGNGNITDIGKRWVGLQASEAFDQGELNSDEGGNTIRVGFRNYCPFPLLLCWVSDDSQLHFFYRLSPQPSEESSNMVIDDDQIVSTFSRHTFCFVYLPEDEIEQAQENERLPESASIVAGFMPIDPKENNDEEETNEDDDPPVYLVTISYDAEKNSPTTSQEQEEEEVTGPRPDSFFLSQAVTEIDPTVELNFESENSNGGSIGQRWEGLQAIEAFDQGELKSMPEGGERLSVGFRNLSPFPLLLCWVSNESQLHHFYELAPQTEEPLIEESSHSSTMIPMVTLDDHIETTYSGHAFCFVHLPEDEIEDTQENERLPESALVVAGFMPMVEEEEENNEDGRPVYLVTISYDAENDNATTPQGNEEAHEEEEEGVTEPINPAGFFLKQVGVARMDPTLDLFDDFSENDFDEIYEDLLEAVADGDLALVQELLDNDDDGADVNPEFAYSDKPLHVACSYGHLMMGKLLIENYGADVNGENYYGQTPLNVACASDTTNRFEIVALLIEKGANLHAKDHDGTSALHEACIHGHFETIQFLILNGANVQVKDDVGDTPLHRAFDNLEIAKLLIQNGADVGAKNENGETVLHLSCEHGDLQMIQFLMDNGADLTAKREDGETPLHRACISGNLQIIKFLIEKEADIHAKDEEGKTPIHWACHHRQLETVKLLMENGADVHSQDNYEQTPLHLCDSLELFQWLIENGGADATVKDHSQRTPLHRVCYEGRVEIIQFLIEKGFADVHAKDNQGMTSFHDACDGGDLEAVKLLLVEYATDAADLLHSKNNRGETPLHRACYSGHWEVAKLLIEKKGGANSMTAKDKDGKTPFHWAIEHHHPERVKFFIEHGGGAAVNMGWTATLRGRNLFYDSESSSSSSSDDEISVRSDDDHERPRRSASRRDHHSRVQALLEELDEDNTNDDVNVVDYTQYRCTPLHWACLDDRFQIVQLLIHNGGADVHATDDDYGMTPLHLVCYLGFVDMVQFLLRRGANANAELKQKGWTPLDLACKENHLDVVWFLVRQDPCLVVERLE